MNPSQTDNTKRIAKNTLFLYGRMLFSMLVSLYTSRVILRALGVEDFGIQNVVGGFVAMFSLISSALTSSVSRFLTFELGIGDKQRLREVFSTSLFIQIVMSLIIIVVAETVGLWFVNYKLVIPAERLYAANWVFQFSVFGFVMGLLSTPYNASIISHEKMNIFAYFGIITTLLNLANVLFVAFSPVVGDRLITYSLIALGIGVSMQILYMTYCFRNFPECHVWPKADRNSWKKMSGFAMWNGIGCTAGLLKDQGVNILLNLFFGPVVNAARGLSGSVSGAVGAFTGNFMTAVRPQITKSYAADDKEFTFSLVKRSSRFGFYITMMLAIPMFLEAPFVLGLWLGTYPEHTVIFVRLVLIYSLLETLSDSLITLQNATGKIRNYQIAVGGLLLMNIPFSYLLLWVGAPPYSVYIAAIVIGIGCLLLRLRFLRTMCGLSMPDFLRNVVGNVLLTGMLSLLPVALLFIITPQGWPRFLFLGTFSILWSALTILYVGCTSGERAFILSKLPFCIRRFIPAYDPD